MKIGLCIIAIFPWLIMGPVHSSGAEIIDPDEISVVAKTWHEYLDAASTNNLKKLKNLSADRIRCLFCLENTEVEEKEIEKCTDTDPNWYNKRYEEKVYIPINTFLQEDYPLIFTKKFIERLRARQPAYRAEHFHGQKIYGVIIQTLKPGELSPGHEGSLYIFQFLKTEKGYQFWGIDTIP